MLTLDTVSSAIGLYSAGKPFSANDSDVPRQRDGETIAADAPIEISREQSAPALTVLADNSSGSKSKLAAAILDPDDPVDQLAMAVTNTLLNRIYGADGKSADLGDTAAEQGGVNLLV